MANTNPYGFPYPIGTDRVMDGDNAIQALAEAVNNYLLPADANAPAGGIVLQPSVVADLEGCAVYRRHSVCFVQFYVKTVAATGVGGFLATVAAGYKPTSAVRVMAWAPQIASGHAPVTLKADGAIVAEPALAAGTGIYVMFAYPLHPVQAAAIQPG
jgi:hypothetical protein